MMERVPGDYRIGPRGHFCGGCNKTEILHAGCVTDGSYTVSPDDPRAVASRAARDARLEEPLEYIPSEDDNSINP